ncbi:S8 family serine peptidase [[Kitasatospora] papulosa]|uniref:S8 family serine peptidase n=1 Tax=Streptomyces TaxID=1883 RepID=UPI0022723F0E|nr:MULTISPECIES: S8 family serine peptidase [unclassified Streptomyces]MCY1654518.1 S8 family serine peptidase [Streptomyces sp. SL203]MCY1678183.1 S8 family serine peptidase [Streptomyces sp. SL294]WSZ52610.1 S8 family serine peptidase [[Kitasatospora] papulosa]
MLPAAGPATAAPEPSATRDRPVPEVRDHAITLVTGDVVHWTDGVGGQDTVTVDRPEGATGGVHVRQAGEDLYVIPDEASALLAAEKLDRRLFNISTLVEMGYDDRRSGGIPLIATYAAGTGRSLPTAPRGSTKVRTLESVHGMALKAGKDDARAFWNDITRTRKSRSLDGGIAKLWLDGKVEAALKDSVPQVNAPQAWAEGFDGKGTTVAVLDTGIDATHPDVKDRVKQSRSFVPGEEVVDGNGHGTHVASTIAGSGAASDGANKGVAPAADLIVGKVLSNEGSGADSGIIEAMEWAKAEGADVVSMSLGSSIPDDGGDPMAQAVDALSADGGPLFVIAAGNAYGAGTIGSPGSAASALTVAAVDKQDRRADFSSMGPLVRSYGLKPDLSAPGVDINAAASRSVPGIDGMYQSMSGTSMATPHVAGAAAVLKQRHPEWSGQRIKDALMSSSKLLPDHTPYEQGTGRLDVKAAVDTAIEATGSVEVASYDWPHSAQDAVAERTLTYRNTGDEDVTLKLATDTDAAAYTLSTPELTVPAGSTAAAVLSIDPSRIANDTRFSGQVLATDPSGATVAHTGFAVNKERELHDLTLRLRDRAGEPMDGTVVLAALGDTELGLVQVSGETTLRLPPGNYTAWTSADVDGDRSDSKAVAFLSAPETILDKATTVTLDASKARRVSVRTPQETETRQLRYDMARTSPEGVVQRDAYQIPLTYDQLWASPTKKVTQGDFSFLTRWRQGEELIDLTADGRDVPVTVQSGSSVAEDSEQKLTGVFAGNGAAADYQGRAVKGKAVVVTRSDTVPPAERLANALAAGAKALFVVNDARGVAMESYAPYGEETTIPVASVRKGAGGTLIEAARHGRKLSVDQRKFASYVYDLVDRHDGTVPDRSLAFAPSARQLAKVENTFYGHKATLGGGYRYDIPDYGPGIGFEEYEKFPGTRTEWVTPLPGDSFWYENHSVLNADASDTAHEMRSAELDHTAGRTYRADWFAPVTGPRLGTAYWGPFRTADNDVQFNITPWTDSGEGHSGSMPADEYDTTSFAFHQGDTLLKKGAGRAGYVWDLPAGKLPYRLVIDSERDAATWKTSTRTHTEWNFLSGALPDGTERADIPLLQLDYEVDTDLAGDVRAGRTIEVGLASGTQAWLDGAVKATRASLSVSYDEGASWSAAELRKGSAGRWTAKLRTPAKGASSVSLRAHTEGPGGLAVDQEIIKAFGLK